MFGRDLLSIADLSVDDLQQLLEVALAMKRDGSPPLLAGKQVAFLFEKPSLRTRVSFDVGIAQMGGRSIYLSPAEIGLGVREPIKDVARVLSRYVDALVVRTSGHEILGELAHWSTIPVINALSDHEHPCQALADLLTIEEHKSLEADIRVAFVGDGNNVARSLAYACALAEIPLTIASPDGYQLNDGDREQATLLSGGRELLRLVADPSAAVAGADVVYTDVWTSMGQEGESLLRLASFSGYTLDAGLLDLAAPGAIVMHDLPAHRGEEITDEVIESPASVVFDQAENRLHAQKAVLALVLGQPQQV
ncbi:MAG: ornithine carbamoyltransferase [Dehalococcoidia bacterium]|nr:ornithine carbamoyltransferase [Dehalococcoidia bacterium]